jgi:hypothetical protein
MRIAATVAACLIATAAALAIWMPTRTDSPIPPAASPSPGGAVPAVVRQRDVAAPGFAPSSAPASLQLEDWAQLEAWMTANGWDARFLTERYRAWLALRGFSDQDVFAKAGDRANPSQYARLDEATLGELVRSGDLLAIQEDAARAASVDSVLGLQKYGTAVRAGSATAIFAVADIIESLSGVRAEDTHDNPDFGAMLEGIRGDDPESDLREQALAWSLAVVRRDGPAALDGERLDRIGAIARQISPERLDAVCRQSIDLADDISNYLPQESAGRDGPPLFVGPPDLYARLPCRSSPTPLEPPLGISGCQRFPAIGSRGKPVEIWRCPQE